MSVPTWPYPPTVPYFSSSDRLEWHVKAGCVLKDLNDEASQTIKTPALIFLETIDQNKK